LKRKEQGMQPEMAPRTRTLSLWGRHQALKRLERASLLLVQAEECLIQYSTITASKDHPLGLPTSAYVDPLIIEHLRNLKSMLALHVSRMNYDELQPSSRWVTQRQKLLWGSPRKLRHSERVHLRKADSTPK
jgi:hypothetical protein